MSKPHTCPVCEGTGKIFQGPAVTTDACFNRFYVSCHGCNGSGIVWEPQSLGLFSNPVDDPSFHKPYQPIQFEPVIPLTFPKDFEFPADIKEKSREDLIGILQGWIDELRKEETEKKT